MLIFGIPRITKYVCINVFPIEESGLVSAGKKIKFLGIFAGFPVSAFLVAKLTATVLSCLARINCNTFDDPQNKSFTEPYWRYGTSCVFYTLNIISMSTSKIF